MPFPVTMVTPCGLALLSLPALPRDTRPRNEVLNGLETLAKDFEALSSALAAGTLCVLHDTDLGRPAGGTGVPTVSVCEPRTALCKAEAFNELDSLTNDLLTLAEQLQAVRQAPPPALTVKARGTRSGACSATVQEEAPEHDELCVPPSRAPKVVRRPAFTRGVSLGQSLRSRQPKDLRIAITKEWHLTSEPASPKKEFSKVWGKSQRNSWESHRQRDFEDRSADAITTRIDKKLSKIFGESQVDRSPGWVRKYKSIE